jgi:hypothetical protein
MRLALLAMSVLVLAAACTAAGDPQGSVVTTTQPGSPTTTEAAIQQGSASSQEEALIDHLRSRDSDQVWVAVSDREIMELAAAFCSVADQVADLSKQAFSGVDRGNRGQYFMGSIIPQGASPAILIRTGALIAALVTVAPTTCSESAVAVLTDGLDWAVATVG